jgi:hypothetical protein
MLWYFQLVSFSALVTNPVIVPLTFVIMSTALLALGCGIFSSFLAAVFNNANLALTQIMLAIIQRVLAWWYTGTHLKLRVLTVTHHGTHLNRCRVSYRS